MLVAAITGFASSSLAAVVSVDGIASDFAFFLSTADMGMAVGSSSPSRFSPGARRSCQTSSKTVWNLSGSAEEASGGLKSRTGPGEGSGHGFCCRRQSTDNMLVITSSQHCPLFQHKYGHHLHVNADLQGVRPLYIITLCKDAVLA